MAEAEAHHTSKDEVVDGKEQVYKEVGGQYSEHVNEAVNGDENEHSGHS